MMDRRHSSICILGGGPAALISQEFLKRKGMDACIVAKSILGNLAPLQIGRIRVSPIPIFISPESNLFRQLALGPMADMDFVTTSYSPVVESTVADCVVPGSYADSMIRQYDDSVRRLIITKKHLGALPFRRDLPELNRKVLSHYPPGHVPTPRLGFSAGISSYLRYVERTPNLLVVNEAVLAVDVENRRVTTNSHQVTYDRLISTLPLLDFLALASIKTSLTTLSEGAQMVVASTRQLRRQNQLIYDCDSTSPVHPAFIPVDNIVLAQVAREHWEKDVTVITARVQELFDFDDQPVAVKRLTLPSCYPLALSDSALRDKIISDLKRSGVTMFGRLAQWEYLDLEELDWEIIECLL